MKARIGLCTWRPLVGAAVVSALAIAVSVQGSPRVGGERDKGSGKSQASRVVTGPSAHINSAIAQGPGASITLQPVAPPAGSPNPYTAADITGAKVTLTHGSPRVFLEFQLQNFGAMTTWQCAVDSTGYKGANAVCGSGSGGADLVPAVEPCTTNNACQMAFRGNLSAGASNCTAGFCDACFQDYSDAQWIMTGATGIYACSFPPGNLNWGCGTTPLGGTPTEFGPSYGGTLVLDIPAGAKGLYTIGWDMVGTIMQDVDGNPIPVVNANAGQIDIPCGNCCFGVGTPTDGCVNNLSKTECDAQPAAAIFTAGGACVNPPTADGCCACLTNSDCNDGDACTTDVCNSCVCSNTPKTTWDQIAECCDSATGAETTLGCADQCEAAVCSLPGNHGSAGCNARTGLACNDNNPCTYSDLCGAAPYPNCHGIDANTVVCTTSADCELTTGVPYNCVNGLCECKLEPDLTITLIPGGKGFDPECYDTPEKIVGSVFVGASSSPISGAQIALTYDPSCLEYVSIDGAASFPDLVSGPSVDPAAGTIFLAVGVGFGGAMVNGNVAIADFSFRKIGTCNSCEICFTDINPYHTYLADNEGQRIGVVGHCSDPIRANNSVVLTVPPTITVNADCNVPSAVVTWDAPSATDSCGNSTVICRGSFEDGSPLARATAEGGGELPIGKSSFCCYSVSDYCGKQVGCPPNTNCKDGNDADTQPDGCWTVTVDDQTSMDITIGLSPGTQVAGTELTRCIKFTLYSNCDIVNPLHFSDDVTFGGLYEYLGKSTGKVKIPGNYNWSCITAQDQLHTLRSCYTFGAGDCAGGQLKSNFKGDPRLGGNWLIAGNLDGWKKDDPTANPSLDVIDILDYGTFVFQYGKNYALTDSNAPNTPCGTVGPNADINGDSIVDGADYAYLSNNFLTSSKQCCCGPQTAGVNPVTEISVAQLRAMGLGDLAVADLNGDGMLNMADMAAFDQGVRPTKTTPTKDGSRSSGSR